MSRDASDNQPAIGSVQQRPRRRRIWKKRILRIILSILTIYLVYVVMLSSLQRSMIYFPTREAPIEPRDAGLPPGQVHTISVRAHDELELRGWHILPVGRSAANREESDRELAEGRRLVLYFSGNAANRRYRVPEFGIFTDLGLDVFIFDYRGYGDNSGSPSEEMFLADARVM